MQTLFGLRFDHPIGLAAGFDKNGVAATRWSRLGFSFAELGTVTRHAQPGNPRPRLFRLPADRALINRMGFNNHGADALAARLVGARPVVGIPIGVNVGKSKVTPVEDAPADYAYSFGRLSPLADYVVVNVSSPNTPGLRDLQERGPLTEILSAMQTIDRGKPLFVKVSPDLTLGQVDEVIAVVHELGLTGIVATNTTLDRVGLSRDPAEEGGLSGAPLREAANLMMRYLASSCDPRVALIGVGGIFDADDLYERIASGAHLVQLYTGWVYGGPNLVPWTLAQFIERLDREGIRSLSELRATTATA